MLTDSIAYPAQSSTIITLTLLSQQIMSNHHNHYGEDHHHYQHGDGHDANDHVLPIATNASQNLHQHIDFAKLTALNIAQDNSQIFKIFDKLDEKRSNVCDYISSDSDEQILLYVPFVNSSIKLYSIILKTVGGERCPKTIKVFKNKTDLDFDSAESTKPDFVLNHPLLGYEGNDAVDTSESTFVEHFVPRHLFTNVTSLTFFFEEVYGDEDETVVYYIELRGEATKLSKDPIVTMYEAAANPADHKVKGSVFDAARSSIG